ncbi:hypothetical protein F5Y05DRAFT_413507 [Hypoxylon sp. FL0543]|nr:hypothetical protein F5Y05DRAFT_413507 [Hypoxylon sp. FL0543]
MAKVQKSDPGRPSRSDSFLRMLELEKTYKMQRIQGHDPATITSPSTSSPSAQPNKPFKARRASGHPPLSHQTQIMKAVRRSSALPSLSISIPPSPTDGPAAEPNVIPGNLKSKEERTKTVTFSGPDEGEDDGNSSDQSSICQSPSWEQFGRKKKKKPKKREAEQSKRSKEEKSASSLKKGGNKLSKVPPQHIQGVEPLTASRAQSAPELDLYSKSNTANLDTPDLTPTGVMANPKLDSKSKKGFLSGFRLQHGNVAAVQKIIETQRTSTDGSQHTSSPMLKPHPAASRVEPDFTNPRKPPSISSAISNSTRSISSLDQLPPSARHSSGSSHGRSQSLLSSTLSKLKGPSYLYYRPGESTDNAYFHRPSSSQERDASNWLNNQPIRQPAERPVERPVVRPVERTVERPVDQLPERPKERPTTSNEPNQQLPEFTFPPRPKRATTQPPPGAATRIVRDQDHHVDRARLEESGDLGSGYVSPEPTSFRTRRAPVPQARTPSRETAVEKERRPRPERVSRAPRQPLEVPENRENRPRQTRQPLREVERQPHTNRQVNGYVQPQVESWEESKHGPEVTPTSEQGVTDFANGKSGSPEANLGENDEDDRVSVGTHASTIRPISRRQGRNSPGVDGSKHVTFPPNPNTIGRAVSSDPVEEIQETVVEPPKRRRPAGTEKAIPTGKPLGQDRSADYFSFISQSYAPPTLELRSPMEGKFPSPRIDEEPEDDDDLEHILRHIPVRDQVQDVSTPSETGTHTVISISNGTYRILKQRLPKDSPSISSHYSDSDVPAFERLGLSPKAARILAGAETSSTSTSQSNTDPSRANSERSSSSTCDDIPPSPPSAPTPDSSRPQSHKELALSRTDTPGNTEIGEGVDDDERTPRITHRSAALGASAKYSSPPTRIDQNAQGDSWSRTALPIDLENHHTPSSEMLNDLTASPQLIATPTSATFSRDIKENLEETINRNPYQQALPPRAQSALDIHSVNYLSEPKQPMLHPKTVNGGISSVSLPNSPPPELGDGAPRKSALRTSRQNSSNSDEPSALIPTSTGAAYLQEARKTVPVPPVSASRALRPHYTHKNSSNSVKSAVTPESRSDPLAKMLVECCSCKFFHDMPSRVYECMAKPDSLVEDKLLGVSATITTMVKCPWCAHGMTTQCCSGYAAVIYLKEKLHGK